MSALRQVISPPDHAIDFAVAVTTLPTPLQMCGDVWPNFIETAKENTTIRRPFKADAPVKEGPRSNRDIRIPKIQLIDAEGQNLGVVATDEALRMAEEAGLDLVEISPNNDPPVCKILDLGKLKYANQKKAAEARKKQKIVEIKEIKMRPNIDTHDYEVKMKAINRFFEDGDKVRVTLRFRGREMAHQELGMKLLQQVKEDTAEIAKVEAEPKLEGRQMMMVLAPR
ncbi:translation initiation factor IF-3 [Pseudorhizobium tarimense]|uniref:Translation initiation factor IF-3 n=1 Tax=Pseudorhizobium tarimense TaxID=1079109 RepID=A0ABV2H1U1_9HYPH